MRAARATAPPYRLHRGGDRPWVQAYDGDGFPEAWLNDSLQFVAWQGHRPRHVAHEARELIQAATWLAVHGRTWPAGDLGVWTAYGLALAGLTSDRAARLAVYRAMASLLPPMD